MTPHCRPPLLREVALVVALAGVIASAHPVAAGSPGQVMRVPGFGMVTTYLPQGTPQQVVLFLSGDGGWNLGVVSMAERLRDEGALVIGIDVRAFTTNLEASKTCGYPAGALEELSRAVQAHLNLPAYLRPIVVGYSSGASLVYATIAAAPPETFAGGLSLGFCPDLEVRTPFCHIRGLRTTKKAQGVGYDMAPYAGSTVPWMVLHGEQDQVCAPAQTRGFVASTGNATLVALPKVGHGFGVTANWEPQYVQSYREIVRATSAMSVPVAAAPQVADLELAEVPATAPGVTDTMAVILTGDGGWAELDKAVAANLAARGIPVVGWSSLTYYWTPRTPERASADLARIVSHYTAAWHRPRVVVIGYSFGADVAPFLVNRLPDDVRSHVSRLGLLAPSASAAFEFHVAGWIGAEFGEHLPTHPEIERLMVPTVCVTPQDEPAASCIAVNPQVRAVSASPGHHFGGEYGRLVESILK